MFCNGQCSKDFFLLNDKTCVHESDTYLCGVESISKERSCGGRCVPGRVKLHEKCVPKEETVICDGKLQLINKPCNGKCPTDKLGDEINHWEFQEQYQNLTVYFMCKDECLRRDTAWECNGQCQHYSVPCNGKCRESEDCRNTFFFKGQCIDGSRSGCPVIAGATIAIFTGPTAEVEIVSSPLVYQSGTECPQLHCHTESDCWGQS